MCVRAREFYSDILTRAERLFHLDGTEWFIGRRRKASQIKIVKGDPQERSHGENTPEKRTERNGEHVDQTDVQTAVCRTGSLRTGNICGVATQTESATESERETSTLERPTQ